ncbi:hypothetical protein pb186bvf_006442 [Paramecium bursaria]
MYINSIIFYDISIQLSTRFESYQINVISPKNQDFSLVLFINIGKFDITYQILDQLEQNLFEWKLIMVLQQIIWQIKNQFWIMKILQTQGLLDWSSIFHHLSFIIILIIPLIVNDKNLNFKYFLLLLICYNQFDNLQQLNIYLIYLNQWDL